MAKLVNKPITVKYNALQGPLALSFDGLYLLVEEVLDTWKDTGAWWEGEGEKTFFRLQVQNNGLCEIYCENADWYIYKFYD